MSVGQQVLAPRLDRRFLSEYELILEIVVGLQVCPTIVVDTQ